MIDDSKLLYFCEICRENTEGKPAGLGCTIEHSVKRYKKGDYIAYQGDEIKQLYLLNQGRVKTEVVSDLGLSLPIEEIAAPYPLAAAFLFAHRNRFPVDVVALEACELILIEKEVIEKKMQECPNFLRGFLAFTADRMQFLSERLKLFSIKGIKGKLAFYILRHRAGETFDLERNISSLAEYFGVERPSLSRALSELQREGIIEYRGTKGRITNQEAFRKLL